MKLRISRSMKLRVTSFSAAATVTVLSIVAGCGGEDPPASQGTAGSPAAGTNAGGSGGLGSGGKGGTSVGTAGSGVGGSVSTGATGGVSPGSAGQSSGGTGVAGSGGKSSGGVNSGGSSGQGTTGGVSGGGTSGGEIVPATFATVKEIIGSNLGCTGADCHGGNEHNPMNLVLNDQLYTRLTTRISERCGNIPVVNPGKPAESALVKLLKGSCGMTPRMPPGCIEDEFGTNCTPPEYITAVEQWIAKGAPKE